MHIYVLVDVQPNFGAIQLRDWSESWQVSGLAIKPECFRIEFFFVWLWRNAANIVTDVGPGAGRPRILDALIHSLAHCIC